MEIGMAAKEDGENASQEGDQRIVALKNNGVEEPWTIERVAKFIDLLGNREITLTSGTELATIAFRNRVAEMCKAEVSTEDAVKRDKRVENGLIEKAVMLMREIIRTISVTLKAARKNHSVTNLLSCRGWWNMQDASCPDAKRVVTGRRHLKKRTATNRHKSASRLATECWQSKSPQIQRTESIPDAKQQRRMFSLGIQMVHSEFAKSEDWNLRAGGKPSTV